MKNMNTPKPCTIGGITFEFTQVYSTACSKFFVTARNDANISVVFEMKKDSLGRWKMIDPVPEWVAAWESFLISKLHVAQDNVYSIGPTMGKTTVFLDPFLKRG